MNRDYVLITDSSCDLPASYYKEHEVPVVMLSFMLEGKEYMDDAGISISYKDFYDKLRGGQMSVTSMVNVQRYTDEFSKHLEEGKDIFYFGFSSGLSGSYGNAALAAQELAGKYPERKIVTVDSLAASMGQGLLLNELVKRRDEGYDIDQLFEYAEKTKLNAVHLFTVDSLMHLHRGGRLSKASAVAGTIMGIKPMLDVSSAGKLEAREKVRSRKSAIARLVSWMGERAATKEFDTVMISHGDCIGDVKILEEKLREKFQIKQIIVNEIGPVIGSHSGPGTIALFFFGNKRVN